MEDSRLFSQWASEIFQANGVINKGIKENNHSHPAPEDLIISARVIHDMLLSYKKVVKTDREHILHEISTLLSQTNLKIRGDTTLMKSKEILSLRKIIGGQFTTNVGSGMKNNAGLENKEGLNLATTSFLISSWRMKAGGIKGYKELSRETFNKDICKVKLEDKKFSLDLYFKESTSHRNFGVIKDGPVVVNFSTNTQRYINTLIYLDCKKKKVLETIEGDFHAGSDILLSYEDGFIVGAYNANFLLGEYRGRYHYFCKILPHRLNKYGGSVGWSGLSRNGNIFQDTLYYIESNNYRLGHIDLKNICMEGTSPSQPEKVYNASQIEIRLKGENEDVKAEAFGISNDRVWIIAANGTVVALNRKNHKKIKSLKISGNDQNIAYSISTAASCDEKYLGVGTVEGLLESKVENTVMTLILVLG